MTYDEHVAAAVASFPPLTDKQLREVAMIMFPNRNVGTREPTQKERDLRRLEDELRTVESKMRTALNGCRYCGNEQTAHTYRAKLATGFHDFEPLRPADIIEVASKYQEDIDSKTSAIEELRS